MASPTPTFDELNALWRERYGQPLPITAEPELIVRVMREMEDRSFAPAPSTPGETH